MTVTLHSPSIDAFLCDLVFKKFKAFSKCFDLLTHLVFHVFVCSSTDNDNVLPPGMHARGKQPGGKKSSSTKLTIGLVVTFILVLLIAIGIVGFLLYRRKRSHQFDYQKQVLYSEDKAEEFEIFT